MKLIIPSKPIEREASCTRLAYTYPESDSAFTVNGEIAKSSNLELTEQNAN
jgi:hypothetical protein